MPPCGDGDEGALTTADGGAVTGNQRLPSERLLKLMTT